MWAGTYALVRRAIDNDLPLTFKVTHFVGRLAGHLKIFGPILHRRTFL